MLRSHENAALDFICFNINMFQYVFYYFSTSKTDTSLSSDTSFVPPGKHILSLRSMSGEDRLVP